MPEDIIVKLSRLGGQEPGFDEVVIKRELRRSAGSLKPLLCRWIVLGEEKGECFEGLGDEAGRIQWTARPVRILARSAFYFTRCNSPV